MLGKRLMIDTSKCIACKGCQVACKQWHGLPAEDTSFTGSYQNPPDMSGANLTVAKFVEKEEESGRLKWLFFKDQCRHCETPVCREVCPVAGAIVRQADGIVRVVPAKCKPDVCTDGDPKLCQMACPYSVPKRIYKKNGSVVKAKMRKCDFCYNRYLTSQKVPAKSRKPSCQLACPPEAIISGKPSPMMTKANARVTYLRSNGFPDANVYPPQGGYYGPTHVIWVLTEKPSVYGLNVY